MPVTTSLRDVPPPPDAQVAYTDANGRPTQPFFDYLKKLQAYEQGDQAALFVNLRRFGAVGDGVTDDAPAMSAALASLPAGGGAIFAPSGKYSFASEIDYSLVSDVASLSIFGAGQDATIFYFPNATNGFNVSYSKATHSVHFRDFSITTGQASGGIGINLVQTTPLGAFAQTDISRVTFRGDDNVLLFYWTTGLLITGVSGVDVDFCTFYGAAAGTGGTGALVQGQSAISPHYSVIINLTGCTFNWLGKGFQCGTYVQGVTVEQCNFTNGTTGIDLPVGAIGATQLDVISSQFNVTGDQISLAAAVTAVSVSDCLFYVASGKSGIANTSVTFGLLVHGCQFTSKTLGAGTGISGVVAFGAITGNRFETLLVGFSQGAGSQACTFSGNIFQGNPTSGTGILIAGTQDIVTGNIFYFLTVGVSVPTTTNFVNIQSNQYGGCTANTNPAATVGNVVVGGGSA